MYAIGVDMVPANSPLITLVTTPSCLTPTTTNPTITATISTPTGTINDTRIWFRKLTGGVTPGSWYQNAGTLIGGTTTNGTWSFTVTNASMGGVSNGDAVQYYLAASNTSGYMSTHPYGGSGLTPPVGSTPPASFFRYDVGVPYDPFTTPWVQNFDGPNPGVTFSGGTSSWRIGTPLGTIGPNAFSPNNALVCQQVSNQQYQNNEQSWAMIGTFDFSQFTATNPIFTFYHKRDMESSWDGGRVEYSTNCGQTWTTIGTFNDPNGVNWYNAASVNSSGGQPVWTGQDYSAWKKSVIPIPLLSLTPAQKSSVQIRFYFSSDGSVTYAGWAIDDVAIGNFPQKDIEVTDVEMLYAANTWTRKENQEHTIRVWLKNNGWETNPTSVTVVYKVGSMPANASDGVAQTFTGPTLPWAGNTAVLNFTTPYSPGPVGGSPSTQPPPMYPVNIYVRAFYTGDQVSANDSKNRIWQIQRDDVYGGEDFENWWPSPQRPAGLYPIGWTSNPNPGGWGYSSGFMPPGAVELAAYSSFSGAVSPTTMVSPPALLNPGSSYRVRFRYRSLTGTAQSLELLVGQTPNPGTMTVLQSWNFSTTTPTNAVGPQGVAPAFNTDPSAAMNYYIAFRVTTPVGSMGVLIDDVYLDKNPTPPPKIGWGPINAPEGTHKDLPTDVMAFSAIYKQAVKISKTWEVVSTTYNYGAPGDFWWDAVSITPWVTITKAVPDPGQYGPSPYGTVRPRQKQTFTVTVDPTGFGPGQYMGTIRMYGRLYNSLYPNGVDATNQILNVPVLLTVTDAGSGRGGAMGVQICRSNLGTSPTWTLLSDQYGAPMAAIQVTSGTIANICITTYPNQMPQGRPAGMVTPERYFTVSSGGTFTANIRWYYTDGEAILGGVTRKDQLLPINQATSGGLWTIPTTGVLSWTSDPISNYVQGNGYTPSNLGGNHAMGHQRTPKEIGVTSALTYGLEQNYPNPFNPETKIEYTVSEESHVTLVVYNSLGEEVARLVDEVQPAGRYSVQFSGKELPSGTYMYRLRAGSFSDSKRMMLAK